MKFAFATLALAGAVSAHTTFQYFQVGGVDYGSNYIRAPPNNNPIENVNSSDMACNVNGNNAKPNKATVPAGSTFTAEFHHEGRSSQGVDPSHKGPTIAYLAKVSSATSSSASGLSWFKIHEDGYSGGRWAVDKFNANGGKWSFTIPTWVQNGDYLLRAETIALHSAGNYPGAQLYMGCAQITITGGGGSSPSRTVSFPGAYSGSDPGIKVNIYGGSINYIVPGGSVATGGGGGGSQPQNPTTTTSSPPVTSNPPSSGGAPLYGQCGGIGWSGATTCSQGTCTKSNDYYSQCLP